VSSWLSRCSWRSGRDARASSRRSPRPSSRLFHAGLQAYAAAPANARLSLMKAMESPIHQGWLDWRAWLSLPVRAAAGDAGALGLWSATALIVFFLATFAFGKRFANAAVVSAGAPSPAMRERRPRAFRADLGATMRSKERRLVLRDPWLISQIVLQAVYMLPISFILWRNGGLTGSPGMVFSPLIVVIGAQLAGSLAWLACRAKTRPIFCAPRPSVRGKSSDTRSRRF